MGTYSVYAVESKNKIEVTAKHLESTKTTVNAKGGVVVYYDDAVIKASSVFYNKTTKLLRFDGNVEMIGYKGTKEHLTHLEIHTENQEVTFEELFFVTENDLWLFTEKARKSEGNYTFGRSVLSSCNVNNPVWKMVFARSSYDSKEQYMKLYDTKVYVADIPIFYTPYMAFSTYNKRSSGLLFPLFGYSSEEGMVYEQPIFWAISPSMDMEFNPQIRTNRSVGIYSTFRFADSRHSSGKLRVGYFKDKQSYVSEYNLPNDTHYGLEFNYKSSQIISHKLSKDFTDGLYINTTFLNDIDYLNLQKTQMKHFGLVPLQESRLNYFLHNNNYYTGINAKYFIDTRKVDNDDTLQILPSLQLHKYLDHFLWNNFTYNVDFKMKNLDRQTAATLSQAELKIPLEFTASLFEDFLSFSLTEDFYYSKFFFGNDTFIHDKFEYYSHTHKVKFFTDLTKNYGKFIHVLQPSFEYLKPGNESEKPVSFNGLTEEQKELFTVGLPEEHYTFSLNHYFYDDKMKLKFYQRLSQMYYADRVYKFSDLSNEMQYNWKNWKFYNDIVYAPQYNKIRESSTRISLDEEIYKVSLGHTYKKVLEDQPNILPANDLSLSFVYNYSDKVKMHGGFTYNIDESSSKQWKFGGRYKEDCWSVGASIRQEITPRPTGYTTDNTFYIQFSFIPFVSFGTGDVK
ncbi:MAG: LPS-assembly protein LptD [Campylobacterota bacterium]|nr:LPS-assembly protein LptD [Campylobacterota bacterium]